MRKYGESKTNRIMMATVPHVISGLGLRKFQADGFLLTRVWRRELRVLRDDGLYNLYSEPGTIMVVSLIFSVVELREQIVDLDISNANHQLRGMHSV